MYSCVDFMFTFDVKGKWCNHGLKDLYFFRYHLVFYKLDLHKRIWRSSTREHIDFNLFMLEILLLLGGFVFMKFAMEKS